MKKKYQKYLASILMGLYQNEIFKSQKNCYPLTKMLTVFAAIRKYQNHPSIQIIWTKHRNEKLSNYWQFIKLQNFAKIFENVLNEQMNVHFSKELFLNIRAVLKRTKCKKLIIINYWKIQAMPGPKRWILLHYLLISDYVPHNLIIAKLHAYGFDLPLSRLIYNYWRTGIIRFSNKFRRTLCTS